MLNRLQWSSHNCAVSVNFCLDGPESITIQPAKRVGVKGRAFTFTCSADGLPQPTYWWMPPNGQYQVGKTLTLKDIQFADGGIYTCWARNTINSGFRSIRLQVMFQVEGKMLLCLSL